MEPSNSQLKTLLQDVRKMRRSIKLRTESDPEVVVKVLDTILKEAITLRSFNSGSLGKGAVDELRNIRRDLVAAQINTGGKTAEFVGKYSVVLDQIDKIESETSQESGQSVAAGIKDSITNSLPSADALTAALMTANPVLGYTVKMGRDLLNARKRAKERLKMKQDQRIAALNKEEKKTEEEYEEKKESGSPIEEQEALLLKLDSIREEIQILSKVLQGNYDSTLEQTEEAKDSNAVLEKVSEESQSTNENLEKIANNDEKRLRKERSDKGKKRLKERETEFESAKTDAMLGVMTEGTSSKNPLGLDPQMFGIFSGLGGVIGGLASKIFTPIKFVLGFLVTAGLAFAKIAAVGTIVGSVVSGIVGFFDGLFNAAEVLGKDESDVTLLDRFRAAQTSAIAGFLAPINWLLKQVGWGFAEDQEDIRNKLVDIQNNIGEYISSIFESISKYFTLDFFNTNILPSIESAYNAFKDIMNAGINSVKDAIDGFSYQSFIEKIESGIKNSIESIGKIFDDVFKSALGWIKEKFNSITSIFSSDENKKESENLGEESKSGFIKGLGETFDSAVNFFRRSSEPTAKELTEKLEERNSGLAGSLYGSNQVLNDLHSSAMSNSPFPSVFAPKNTTNVNNNIIQQSSGSRNQDESLNRIRSKIYMQ